MRVTLNEVEQGLIRAVLQLANLREIRSTKQVERVFTELPFFGFYDKKGRHRFQGLPPSEVGKYRTELQPALKEYLASIASGEVGRRKEVEAKVRKQLVPVILAPSNTGKPFQIYLFAGVWTCCVHVLCLLLDPTRGLTDRLGLCDAPKCGKFNLAFNGRPRRYCSNEHRLAADARRVNDRVKEWRRWVKDHGGKKKREL